MMSNDDSSELVGGGGTAMLGVATPSPVNHVRYRRLAWAAFAVVAAGLAANELSHLMGHVHFQKCNEKQVGASCGGGKTLRGSPPVCICI